MNYIEHNENPKNKLTGDCVIRAIAYGLGKSWSDVYKDLCELGLKYAILPNNKYCYTKYLSKLGYKKQKMPIKRNDKRYTIKEFADLLAEPNNRYIISVAKHLTVLDYNTLIDVWNCGDRCVGNYWIIPKEN